MWKRSGQKLGLSGLCKRLWNRIYWTPGKKQAPNAQNLCGPLFSVYRYAWAYLSATLALSNSSDIDCCFASYSDVCWLRIQQNMVYRSTCSDCLHSMAFLRMCGLAIMDSGKTCKPRALWVNAWQNEWGIFIFNGLLYHKFNRLYKLLHQSASMKDAVVCLCCLLSVLFSCAMFAKRKALEMVQVENPEKSHKLAK